MIAATLLSTTVIGVSGTVLSSYAHDTYSKQHHDAIRDAGSLMAELTALPFDAGATTDVGLMDFANYADTVSAKQATITTAQIANSKGKPQKGKKIKTGVETDDDEVSVVATGGPTEAPRNLAVAIGPIVNTNFASGLISYSTSGGSNSVSVSGTNGYSSSSSSSSFTSPGAPVESRTVAVMREATLNGASTATGDLAVVTVDISLAGQRVIHLKRLISSAEALSSAGQ